MHRNKVGPASTQVRHPTMWKSGRVQSGMSMEDLKHQTALRLANEQRDDPSHDEANDVYRQQHHANNYGGVTAAAPNANAAPPILASPQYHRSPPYNYQQQQQTYDSRNYTDSQLGIASPRYSASSRAPSATNNTSYSTPRNKHALQDRGSAENRSDGENNADVAAAGLHHLHGRKTPLKGQPQQQQQRVGSNSSLKSAGAGTASHSLKKKSAASVAAGKAKDGRVTPVKDLSEPQRILYSTPNTRREITTSTPTSVYSEPSTRIKSVSSSSNNNRSPRPNHHQRSTPDYHKRNNTTMTPANTPYNTYKVNPTTIGVPSSQQSKLPHGLTVQELKEMTRARLAAEANYENTNEGSSPVELGTGSNDELQQQPPRNISPHNNHADVYLQPPPSLKNNGYMTFRKTSADGSIGSNGNLNGYGVGSGGGVVPILHPLQQQQGQHHPLQAHQRMQVQAANTAAPPQHHSSSNMHYPYPRHPSPVYHATQKTRTGTWEGSSSAPLSEYQVPDLYPQGSVSFSSPTPMNFNRGRCFSAGATTTTASTSAPPGRYEASSWEEQRPSNTAVITNESYRTTNSMYYDTENANNRPRCATMSPPGMSRLHREEYRPFLFSSSNDDTDKEDHRLAIPPLLSSEPRPRFHTTGVLLGNSSAFEPIMSGIHHRASQRQPPSSPKLIERVKFNVEDRMMSTGSNGDLPSSVAEAVLESLTASTGPMMDHLFDSSSPFRSSALSGGGGKSPFRKSSSQEYSLESSGSRIVTESSGSGSLFSVGGGGGDPSSSSQKSFFSSSNDYTNDRMLSVTNSWGGEVEDMNSTSSFGFSQEFNNLLIGSDGPALRGRAQTAPCFGENHLFVGSKLDPEHRLEDNGGGGGYDSIPMMLGFGRSTNLPPGFDKPSGSG